MIDQVTMQRIALLHPSVRTQMASIITTCNTALTGQAKVRITQGLRTYAEQQKLYAQGRTLAGKKVTNAKAGQSVHNYGFAVDVCLIINHKEASWNTQKDWDADTIADWKECVNIFKAHGWAWGGDWKNFKDLPHFDKAGFNNWRILKTLKTDKDNYVII